MANPLDHLRGKLEAPSRSAASAAAGIQAFRTRPRSPASAGRGITLAGLVRDAGIEAAETACGST